MKRFLFKTMHAFLALTLLPPPTFGAVKGIPVAYPTEKPPPQFLAPPVYSRTIALLLKKATSDGLISGGIVLVGNSRGIVSVSAHGRLGRSKGSPELDQNTIFDLASLTKVVATAPAVMKLVEQGRISLSDPLSRWFPEFRRSPHARIRIVDLLTHTSGLEDMRQLRGQALHSVIHKAAAERSRVTRHHFKYADINFILLGELVRRVSGQRLDLFCRDQIFFPLGMLDTMYRPPKELDAMIAPTKGHKSGVVQDVVARRLGNVAGHAGLFSSASDLSRYARAMLGGGMLDGKRILSRNAIARMTTPRYDRHGAVRRGLGWDISSPFSAPRGNLFSERSFGHTGYSGSSIWIDPKADLFVILLTNRLNYRNVSRFNRLRQDVSTVAAAQFGRIDERRHAFAQREMTRITRKALLVERPSKKVSRPRRRGRHA